MQVVLLPLKNKPRFHIALARVGREGDKKSYLYIVVQGAHPIWVLSVCTFTAMVKKHKNYTIKSKKLFLFVRLLMLSTGK